MKITIGTPKQLFQTIGHTERYEPVLYFKIGKRKQAIEDLTIYLSGFDSFLNTIRKNQIEISELEYITFANRFNAAAKTKALLIIERCIMYNDRFFTFLPLLEKIK